MIQAQGTSSNLRHHGLMCTDVNLRPQDTKPSVVNWCQHFYMCTTKPNSATKLSYIKFYKGNASISPILWHFTVSVIYVNMHHKNKHLHKWVKELEEWLSYIKILQEQKCRSRILKTSSYSCLMWILLNSFSHYLWICGTIYLFTT